MRRRGRNWLVVRGLSARARCQLFASQIIAGLMERSGQRFVAWLGNTRVGAYVLVRLLIANIQSWKSTGDIAFYLVAFRFFWSSGLADEIAGAVTSSDEADEVQLSLRISGWAGVLSEGQIKIRVTCPGLNPIVVQPTQNRPDVIRHFHLLKPRKCGFRCSFSVPSKLNASELSGLKIDLITAALTLPIGTAGDDAIALFGLRTSDRGVGFVDLVEATRSTRSGEISMLSRLLRYDLVRWLDFALEQDLGVEKKIMLQWLVVGKYLIAQETAFLLPGALDTRFFETTAIGTRLRQFETNTSGIKSIVRAGRDARSWLSAETINPGWQQTIGLPQYSTINTETRRLDVEMRREQLFRASDVTLLEHGVVVRGTELLVWEPAADPVLGFIAGIWMDVIGSPLDLDKAVVLDRCKGEVQIDRAILVTTRVPTNYFHLLIENIARMVSIETDDRFSDFPLIVSKNVPDTGLEAIRACLPGREIIASDSGVALRVGDLVSPSFHTNPRDNTLIPWFKGAGLSPRHLDFLRSKLLPIAADSPSFDHIYLSRQSGGVRSLINHDEVENCMRRLGFSVVDPTTLTLSEQVSVFSRAKVIIGVGGAAMTNLVFVTPGTKIVCLLSEQLADFYLWSNLASIVGASMTYFTGPSHESPFSVSNHREYFHLPFAVDVRKLERTVLDVVSDSR
jgi:capsular polysaccharide biosynthesis protein